MMQLKGLGAVDPVIGAPLLRRAARRTLTAKAMLSLPPAMRRWPWSAGDAPAVDGALAIQVADLTL
jgi:hypothetical protein